MLRECRPARSPPGGTKTNGPNARALTTLPLMRWAARMPSPRPWPTRQPGLSMATPEDLFGLPFPPGPIHDCYAPHQHPLMAADRAMSCAPHRSAVQCSRWAISAPVEPAPTSPAPAQAESAAMCRRTLATAAEAHKGEDIPFRCLAAMAAQSAPAAGRLVLLHHAGRDAPALTDRQAMLFRPGPDITRVLPAGRASPGPA